MVTELYTWKQETPPDFDRFEFTVVVNLGYVHVCRHDMVTTEIDFLTCMA